MPARCGVSGGAALAPRNLASREAHEAQAALCKVGASSSVLEVKNPRCAQTTQLVDGFAGAPCPMLGARLTHFVLQTRLGRSELMYE